MKIDKTYIVHYEPLTERKKYLDSILDKISTNYQYFFMNENTDIEIKKNKKNYYLHDKNILERELTHNELGVSITHLKIYEDIVKNNYNISLILEDDVIVPENFNFKINEILNEDIKIYDFIFLSTCCGITAKKVNEKNIQPFDYSKCVNGYLVNKKNLKKILNESKLISTNIDNHLNLLKNKLDLNFGVCEPPILIQGSESTHYKSNLR